MSEYNESSFVDRTSFFGGGEPALRVSSFEEQNLGEALRDDTVYPSVGNELEEAIRQSSVYSHGESIPYFDFLDLLNRVSDDVCYIVSRGVSSCRSNLSEALGDITEAQTKLLELLAYANDIDANSGTRTLSLRIFTEMSELSNFKRKLLLDK